MTTAKKLPKILAANAANVVRVRQAADLWVVVLRDDPRVERAYETYRTAHGLVPGVTLDLVALRAALFRDKKRDMAALVALVHDHLEPDDCPCAWLPQFLLSDFMTRVYTEHTGEVLRVHLDGDAPEDWEPGRGAKRAGEHILRDLRWLYDAEVRQPPVPIRQLGRAYLATRPPDTKGDGRGAVNAGIKRAKRYLAALSL